MFLKYHTFLFIFIHSLFVRQEAFNVVTRYDLPVGREDLEQVDNLRYTWQKLLLRALDVNVLLLAMQPHFQEDLRANLERFRQDNIDYCHEYRTTGPMMPGLTPREASDRLILFQVCLINANLIKSTLIKINCRLCISP